MDNFANKMDKVGQKMDSLLGKVGQGIAKAIQKVDNQIFHDFPECSLFQATDRLSIKLKDQQLHNVLASKRVGAPVNFETITFLVRDEDHGKQTVASAQLQSGNGVLLRNTVGKPMMLVRLPVESTDAIGKLMHPSVFTLYKIMRTEAPQNFMVVRSSTDEPVVRIEKVLVSLYPVGKAVGLLGSSCVYWIKSADGQTVYGHIRPKLVVKSNTLVVKFMSTQRNEQLRATMLGTALLLMITDVYPCLRTMLADSMSKDAAKQPQYPSLQQ